ncbi:molybdopterin molybdotransferase MoeA [Pseudogemmobacter sonorensis]|uniref:molybdopterin molybdotransferase MoeA n=1 Tax=Pseudogemmobacter sonorensis TaxID=2989681 RepID=UPI00368AC366
MISLEEATARILALAHPLGTEEVALDRAAGRRLAQPAQATRDQPPFDASAMDGYAVLGDPLPGTRLRVIGEAGAGHEFPGRLGPGEAVRIFTGAPVPPGATRVVLQEDTSRDGEDVVVHDIGSPNIRARGQDFPAGAMLSPRWLKPADLALLASMNLARVTVARRPEVAVISTGDELVMPGETPRPDQIIASNGFALKALCEGAGARVRLLPIARDNEAALRSAFALAGGADVVVTIGGASVGAHDLVGKVAADLGLARAFWKIALRPGKPLMAGRLPEGAVLLGLPGNPVSSLVCGHLFVLPLLRALQGDPAPLPRPRRAVLAEDLPPNGPRAHYMRARLAPDGETIRPFARQDSALLADLAEADALLIRPVGDPARRAGETVSCLPI